MHLPIPHLENHRPEGKIDPARRTVVGSQDMAAIQVLRTTEKRPCLGIDVDPLLNR